MPNCEFANFDITVRGAKSPYSVTARFRNQTADGEFAGDAGQAEWRRQVQALAGSIMTPDAAAIVAAGSELYHGLICGDVRDLWISARTDLERGQIDGLRIRLALQPPVVAALPWESLYDPDRHVAFAATGKSPLVRVEGVYRYIGPPRSLRVTTPLKILVAAPDDPAETIDIESEIKGIRQILRAVDSDKIQAVVLSGRFSVIDLRRKIEAEQPDFVHLITHGSPDGIVLWQQRLPVLVSGAALQSIFERTASVKLVLLNACLSAQGSEQTALSSVGSRLLQAGIPAVIAMQFEIRDDVAIEFAHFLYEELVTGSCPGAIDAAVAFARSSLYALNPGDFSYGTPVLWLNAENGVIFDLADDSAAYKDKAANSSATPGSPITRIPLDKEARWLAQVAEEIDLSRLPPVLKFVARDRQAAIQNLRNLLNQLHYLEDQGNDSLYAEKVIQYRKQKAALLRLQRQLEEAMKHNFD